MESFWSGFEKQAGIARQFGRLVGKGVESAKGVLAKGTSGGVGLAHKIKSAPGQLREGYRRGRVAARNEAALSRPSKVIRGKHPGGVKPTTSPSTKSKHYRDVAKERNPTPVKPKVDAKVLEKSVVKNRSDLLRKATMPVAAGAVGVGLGAVGSHQVNQSQPPMYGR